VGERLGATDLPRSLGEVRAWMGGVRPELAAGRQAREAVRFMLLAPLPLAARGPYGVIAAAAIGLLPGWARRALWLPVVPLADAVAVRPAGRVLLRGLGWALNPPRRAA
ncbi:MAG: oxygenase MpaB family protein, partial [Acidimicrobiales bacterium]